MDIPRHLMFCPPGTLFFDREAGDSGTQDDFAAVTAEAPQGWARGIGPDWTTLTPPEPRLPLQGWKIHVSATPDNCESILARSWDYLIPRHITFKFIRSRKVLLRRNGKYGDRSASGKFATVYPADEAQLAVVLDELGTLLDGEPGPYILSDLRWRSGPLYVRYGGFVARTVKSATGETVHCIEDPEGHLVPDRRGPSFRPPEWVTIPDCLAEAVAARNSGTLDDFPYRAEKALHFSNGGGVYRGTALHTGEPVLLREARPLSGIDALGQDAVARLHREHECLQRLAGLPWIPRLLESRQGHEHHFLVREFVAGETLAVAASRRNPTVPDSAAREAAQYTEWAVDVLDQVERGVRAMHERGVFFGDLHPGNILVRPDGSVAFVDLETAFTDPEAGQIHAAPGFAAPPTHRGPDVDRYALGCLRLALFAPLTTLLAWGPRKVEQLIQHITARYPVPEDYAEKVRGDLAVANRGASHGHEPAGRPGMAADWAPQAEPRSPEPRSRPQHLPRIGRERVTAVAEGIARAATPEREDRLFPGDAHQFLLPEGGTCLAYGAAGVLWALSQSGAEVPAQQVDWLEAAVHRLAEPAPGLYSGLAGIACALGHLGRSEYAFALLKQVRKAEPANDSLLDGLAGIGLAHLHFARTSSDSVALNYAMAAAEQLTERAAAHPPRRGEAGLIRGRAGGALLQIRLYEQTSDSGFLDAAAQLLDSDLRALGWVASPGPVAGTPGGGDGEGWAAGAPGRHPLLANGSGGTAMVLQDYLAHRPAPRFALARDGVLEALRNYTPRTAGLLHGWAGVMLVLTHLTADSDTGAEQVSRLLDILGLFEVGYLDRPAFLGFENLRLSTDLATGAAGVLLAVHAAAGGSVAVPFL
ncbi:class III lanthionine synthetase LanKC [Frankia sp. R82]|uniref:class III lanthionine synthetase LanKC n=1 Tax=Frankia sp. R82 TaxID=2950553 RepID=UPI0020432559|nr:class III lanthionine synthetase LanKC [Frankia sp. R82]MCM3883395.1 class III lanthionine synthetase LanKC [Frankia sp. R82]